MKRLLIVTLLTAATGVHAQAVQDPTRPPMQFIQPVAGAAASGAPVLQSVLLGRGTDARKVAVIDGAMVRVGDFVRGARVTGMTQHAVLLTRGGKRETLTMGEPTTAPAVATAVAAAMAPVTAPAGPVAPVAPPPVAPAGKPE